MCVFLYCVHVESLSLPGDIWHCSSQYSQRCREGSSVQPQGGATRGDLDVFTSQLKGRNCVYVYIVLPVQCNMLHATWYVSDWAHMMPVSNSICSFAFQHNRLPAFKSLHGKNKGRQAAWSGFMFVWWTTTTFTASERTGYTEHREKTVKPGWNGGGEQCRRAAARFYGLGSCSQPPPPGPSSFLRCTVVYTWATMNRVCWKKRGRTMKQWGRALWGEVPVQSSG